MNYSSKCSPLWLVFSCAVVMLTVNGCGRASSKEKKALRAEFSQALREHSYGKATELARRRVKLNPHDNGSWDRLVQAQFGLSDAAGVKQTLDEWRRTMSQPSGKLDE